MEKIKTAVWYVFIGLVLLAMLSLNFFHAQIEALFPLIPSYGILALTALLSLFLVLVLFWRDDELEIQRYQFLTIATHKFRTPLAGIKWAMSTLRQEVTLEERNTALTQIEQAVAKLLTVLDHLVGAVRADRRLTYAYEAVSLRELLEDAMQRLGPNIKEKHLSFTVGVSHGLPLIIVDKQKIQFVIDTLIENAIRYTPQGGSIAVLTKSESGYLVFSVEDSGIGLSRRDRRNLFRKFFRSPEAQHIDPEGLGIALSVAKTIVSYHGGRLWAQSPGEKRGATFYVKLRVSQQG